ncbi:hypothetical protein JL722_1254 [Aureococcus anophagefferens]|nr:hypothetical protein JL722_1254 [Aureococcus anophagefferens]
MRLALATSLATLRRCVAMSAAPKTKVVVLAGPTAVGKSAAALELCRSSAARSCADYLVGRRDDAGDGALDAGARRDAYVDFCRKFRTASRNYAAEQMKWYRRDADFAKVMKTFASKPCAAAADPAALAAHLAAADAAVAVLRAAGGRGDGARDDDTVRLAALKRQKREGGAP